MKFNKFLKTTPFFKSVATLTMGTTIAQGLQLLISPILTRLYTPDDFGLLALFVSIVSLLSVVATGKYELAIILPKKEGTARKIVRLCVLILVISFIVWTLLFYFGQKGILYFLKDKRISFWFYFVPVTVFLFSAFEVYKYYCIRHKAYRAVSESSVLKAGTASIIPLALGFGNTGALGLILGYILSFCTGNIRLFKVFLKHGMPDENKSYRYQDLKYVAGRYKKFPRLTMPSLLINSASVQLPVFVFSAFFSSAVVGFYSMTQRILRLPLTVIGTAVGQAYFQKANEYKLQPEHLKNLTWGLYKKLLLTGVLPLGILLFFGREIFGFVFGKDWVVLGDYAQALGLWYFLVFISSPLSNLFFVLERQKEGLIFHIISFAARAAVLFFCIILHFTAFHTVLSFGIVGALIFFGFIIYLLALAGQKAWMVFGYTILVMIAGIGVVYLFRILI